MCVCIEDTQSAAFDECPGKEAGLIIKMRYMGWVDDNNVDCLPVLGPHFRINSNK